ncbi:MAG: electron transport complex subunit RsxE [Kiritimatiellia bacterium]|nr:electron transport complex subunit E [Lentisphaerota bacterium]
MTAYREFLKGLWRENPVFRLLLGMCPTLAVTTSVENGLGMGLAATFVLLGSNLVVSAVRKLIPARVRIPCYIVIIATFVTVVDLMMNAFAYNLHKNLGIFIPLIVVNCIILGRAEAFASKNTVLMSLVDGLGMGVGFTLALVAISAVREILGGATLMGHSLGGFQGALLMILPPGGFITLGFLLALMNHIQARLAARKGQRYEPPAGLDCRHCLMCSMGQAD